MNIKTEGEQGSRIFTITDGDKEAVIPERSAEALPAYADRIASLQEQIDRTYERYWEQARVLLRGAGRKEQSR